MSSFCTNLRIAKCSHTFCMLRFCYLTPHKNNLIIDDFLLRISNSPNLPNLPFCPYLTNEILVRNELVVSCSTMPVTTSAASCQRFEWKVRR